MAIMPDEIERDAIFLACHRQPARCREIERARIARQLADDKGKVGAAQPFLEREQDIVRLCRGNMDQSAL